MKLFEIVIILVILPCVCLSQDLNDIEELAERNENGIDLENNVDQLTHTKKHKIDLNNADAAILAGLGILNPLQIEALMYHTEQCGRIIDLLELQSIPHFDLKTIDLLLPYVKVSQTSGGIHKIGDVIFDGNYQFFSRLERDIPTSFAYADTSYRGYIGNPYKIVSKFSYRYKNIFRYGFHIEKDAGEEDYLDFLSGYVSYESLGIIRKIILGDFDVNFGQGLISWTGFGFGKGSNPLLAKKISSPYNVYNSSDENLFFRGTSIHLKKGLFDIASFISYNKLDANIVMRDSVTGEISFSSLPNSGLHRNTAEIEDKNRVKQFSSGGRIGIGKNSWHIHYNLVFSKLSGKREHRENIHSKSDWDGRGKYWQSIDYHWNKSNFHFFGEMAYSEAPAVLNGIILSMHRNYAVSVVHRYYSPSYYGFFSSAFAESSGAENEHGLYIGQMITINSRWKLETAFDIFYHPYLKFRKSSPSQGFDLSAKLHYTISRHSGVSLRYSFDQSQQNLRSDEKTDYLVEVGKHAFSIKVAHRIGRYIESRSRFNYNLIKGGAKGMYLSQDLIYKPFGFPVDASVRFAVFDTESNDSKIYSYENDVLYAYSVPAFIGLGYRFYILLRIKALRSVDLWFRYSIVSFPSSETITSSSGQPASSNPDAVASNNFQELKLQLRVAF